MLGKRNEFVVLTTQLKQQVFFTKNVFEFNFKTSNVIYNCIRIRHDRRKNKRKKKESIVSSIMMSHREAFKITLLNSLNLFCKELAFCNEILIQQVCLFWCDYVNLRYLFRVSRELKCNRVSILSYSGFRSKSQDTNRFIG